MTTVTLSAAVAVGIAGDTATLSLSYDLVSAGLRPLVGLRTDDGAAVTCHGSVTVSTDPPAAPEGEDPVPVPDPLVSWDLTPQAQIVTPDGEPSYYRIEARSAVVGGPIAVWIVQVPAAPATVDLFDLVGAATIPAPVIDRILSTDERAALDAATAPSAANPIATLADLTAAGGWVDAPTDGGIYGRQDGEWIEVQTAGGGTGTVTSVAISGSGGIHVDSGSPITGAGTIALSIPGGTFDAAGTAAAAVSAHAGAGDPHPGYRLESASVAWADLSGVPSTFAPTAHAASHGATGSDALTIGLGQLAQGGAVSGQVVKWSGSAWAPGDDASGGGGIADAPSDASYYARHAAGWSALGSAALAASGDFATATQGANGATAYGWGNHASAGYLTSVTYGTTAGTACQGNDARLSDARTPTSHDHASNKLSQANTHESADTDVGTTSLHHTLGTGAHQAAPGTHTHAATDIASGTIATARLGSGSASTLTWLRGDGAWTSLPADLDPEWCVIALTAPTAGIAAKTRANFFIIPMACTVSDFSVFCDPSNKPTGTVIVDMNTVNQSTGASTSALSATAQIASGANTGTGPINGTLTCAAGDMIDWDIDQGTTGKGLFAKFKLNPTG